MNGNLVLRQFKEISLEDSFFDSLKTDYSEFESWFLKKREEQAYVLYDGGKLQGFLYVKFETDYVDDVIPEIRAERILKIGTFKINAHGTKLGERFIKRIMDITLKSNIDLCYVTIFEKHSNLINLLKKYGFCIRGIKKSKNGLERVLIKDMNVVNNNIYKDYPRINNIARKYLLSVYPKYHTNLFPDSILHNESYDVLTDVSHTNSIHKAYVCRVSEIENLRAGDLITIYRTSDGQGSAEYRSVATSICTVESVKKQSDFYNFEEFYNYTSRFSVFDREDLQYWYNRQGCYVIKMIYNTALNKRIIRRDLADLCDINRNAYWGFLELSDFSFDKILELGGVDESFIID